MSFLNKLHKKNIIAKPGFNRWLVPPASIAIHLCIGSVYAWSMFNPALVKILGVVTSSGDDWNLGQVVWIFSVAILFALVVLAHIIAATIHGTGFIMEMFLPEIVIFILAIAGTYLIAKQQN